MKTLGEAFSFRMNELLKERNISLYKFLKDNNIARTTIINIQKGNTKSPTLAIVYQVAVGFNMSPTEFLSHPAFDVNNIEFI